MKLLDINFELLQWMLVPVTSVVTWLVSTRKRRNDTLASIQTTVDLLVNKNHELVEKLTEANIQIAEQSQRLAEQSAKIAEQNQKIDNLTREMAEMKQEKDGCKQILSELQARFDK